MRVTLLGTGTSTGVPVLGCTCEVCTSLDLRDQRLRCAAFIEVNGLHIVIDTGPDFRLQALRHQIRQVDAVLFTHHHFDHVVGMEDLRPYLFYNPNPIPCYTSPDTARYLQHMFGYIFEDGSYPGVPKLTLKPVLTAFEAVGRYGEGTNLANAKPPSRLNETECVQILPIPIFHGKLPIYGYRIGGFAYLTDCSEIPESSFGLLKGLEILVLDALRPTPHPTHFSIAQAVAAAERIGAKETYFIHMAHQVLHERETAGLPAHMFLAYDGLVLHLA